MASPTIRTTYALDQETVQRLNTLARQWGVSKSAALRRAISMADAAVAPGPDERLAALRQVQKSLALTPARVEQWVREVRAMRRAGTKRIIERHKRHEEAQAER